MNISFGIEFEFDLVRRNGNKIYREYSPGYTCIDTWDYQEDCTCAVELRSPVFTSIDHALDEISRQFRFWCEQLSTLAPYAYNDPNRSIGNHIHIGFSDCDMTRTEKKIVAKAIARIYPFLIALSAQPLPSYRGLNTSYARPIYYYRESIPIDDHYCEISDSAHGTVEFRIFDSNIPQVALANAFIMTRIAEKALENNNDNIDINLERYRRDREIALRYGLRALDVSSYIQEIHNIVGNIEIPNYPFLRELLYLAVKHRLNVWNVKREINISDFRYFRRMFTNPSAYTENILELAEIPSDNAIHSVINDVIENALSINTLNDLVEIAIRYRPMISIASQIPLHSRNLPLRTYVANCIASNDYRIRRITEVYNTSVDSVADRISYLLRTHGNNFVNLLDSHQVINNPERFYVLVVRDPNIDREVVLGCIAIRVSSGEITSLVVDRRYRRLGIASLLLRHVRNVSNSRLYGYVKANNEVMINLLRNLGFSLERVDDGTYRFYESEEGGI